MRWISVKERLPEYDKDVLLLGEFSMTIGNRYRTDSEGEHYRDKACNNSVTGVARWMNLPKVPQTKNRKE